MKLTTREATAEDAGLIRGMEAILQSRSEADFAERVFAAGWSVVLGFADDAPAGYAVINWSPSYALFARLNMPEMQDLNVLPQFRNHGLGAMIVAACEDLARRRGHEQMGLAVGLTRSYGPAQRLYTRLGYLPDGCGITHDRSPVSAGQLYAADDHLCLMMTRDLLS